MSWIEYRLRLRLEGPLHAGMHKVGNLQRTRRYVPAQTITGAAIARLAGRFNITADSGYADLRSILARQIMFGTFFPAIGDGPALLPWYRLHNVFCYFKHAEAAALLAQDEKESTSGPEVCVPAEFERQLIGSWTSTALRSGAKSAEDGSIHEVEYLAARASDGGRVHLVGSIFVREDQLDAPGSLTLDCESDDVRIRGSQSARPYLLFGELLDGMQIGGERRYGFGRVATAHAVRQADRAGDAGQPEMNIHAGDPFPGHVEAATCPDVHGVIEPLIGLRTSTAGRYGQEISEARICWAPGSCLTSSPRRFALQPAGTLRALSSRANASPED